MRLNAALAALMLVSAVGTAAAAEDNPARHRPGATPDAAIQRVIVKFRGADTTARVQAQSATNRISALASRTRLSLKESLSISPDLEAVRVDRLTSNEPLAEILARLRADPDVEYAEPDQRRYPHAVPDDPLFASGQWHLKSIEASAIDAIGAWDVTTGSPGVVIAVLDTGVRYDHVDIKRATGAGRLLPGFDFVSGEASAGTFRSANDGNGRDSDPSDPGDWITSADANTPLFDGCTVDNSSWHGTRTAGIVGALSNNTVGVTGLTWSGWLLPVRVLGKCGGSDSDVLAGMRWAAGLHVAGAADNPYPAKVINMSLGAAGNCPASYQSVINELTAQGVVVVVSAGNEGGPVDAPANCVGAVGVAGLRHAGTKVGFSSLGPQISVGAPGGNCPPDPQNPDPDACKFSIDTTSNAGTTTPGASNYTNGGQNVGTSFSAPIVAGVAGLMRAVNGNLNTAQLIARLKEGATAFPSDVTKPNCHVPASSADIQDQECNCSTSTCGAGMVNARKAVGAALRPIAAVAISGTVAPGQDVTLQGAGSSAACNHAVSTYAWTIVNPGSNPPAIAGADTDTATVEAPATDPFVVRLTVTDDAGLQDTADVTVNPTSATTSAPANAGSTACPTPITIQQTPDPTPDPPPPPTPDPTPTPTPQQKSGGGGAFDLFALLAGLLVVGARKRRLRTGQFA